MSDDEEQVHSEEDFGGRRTEMAAPEDTGPSEAELAMQRRKAQLSSTDLDEAVQEMLEANRELRRKMDEEIQEMRARSERRKRERAEEEKMLAEKRAAEDAERKAIEEEKKRKKEEEEMRKREERAKKMAEFEKFKNPPGTRNFVITKREGGGLAQDDEDSENTERKSKEQLEAEKRAILQQRIQPLNIDGFNESKLTEKAKELHKEIYRLEAEKYDLEKRFKEQQYDMMELAERARQVNKVGKGGLKRVQLGADETDKISERFAGAPAKIEMYSKYERQKDKRAYGERQQLYQGPMYSDPVPRVNPKRKVNWDELTATMYYDESGAPPPAAEPEPEPAAAEGEE